LTGFALSFALKDALSNVLAGAMILLYRPFTTGSRISVGGFQGEVTQIDLRYTRLKSAEQDVLLPNSTLLTTPIVVLSRSDDLTVAP
jgi:small-conductance mechanosensitive channel